MTENEDLFCFSQIFLSNKNAPTGPTRPSFSFNNSEFSSDFGEKSQYFQVASVSPRIQPEQLRKTNACRLKNPSNILFTLLIPSSWHSFGGLGEFPRFGPCRKRIFHNQKRKQNPHPAVPCAFILGFPRVFLLPCSNPTSPRSPSPCPSPWAKDL